MFKNWAKLKDKVKRSLEELSRNLEQSYPQRVPVRVPVPQPTPKKFRRFYSTSITPSALTPIHDDLLKFQRFIPNSISKFIPKYSVSSFRHNNSNFKPVIGIKASFLPPISIISLIKSINTYDRSNFYDSITKKYQPMGCNIQISHSEPKVEKFNDLENLSSILASKIDSLKQTLNDVNSLLNIGNLPVSTKNDKIVIHFNNSLKSEVRNLLIDHNINYYPIKDNNVNLKDLNNGLYEESHINEINNEVNNDIRVKFGLDNYSIDSNSI
ncbi:hypothetical protein CLIB1444_04S10462 [[Candida] jaroonii]|uniref:Uncharacterized protein n=1 Tax=[Candida] jaroonii TaxID=467808 RepID=A0ACA9Y7C9_9ASCO|nr:hypothetical protein CLIB1444_04S10462 [[Candida] jaroonii]